MGANKPLNESIKFDIDDVRRSGCEVWAIFAMLDADCVFAFAGITGGKFVIIDEWPLVDWRVCG